MKLKYYLRGIGVGILFSTIILSISFFTTNKAQLSDAEVIKRAEALGMVNEDDVDMDDLLTPSTTPAVEESDGTLTSDNTLASDNSLTAEGSLTPSNSLESSNLASEEMQEEDTSKGVMKEEQSVDLAKETTKTLTAVPAKTVDGQTEDETNTDTSSITLEADEEETNKTFISFEIKSGMTSEDVANLLKDKGIIEDAKAFNQYLIQNNYTKDINTGKYEVEKFASYEEIADTIVK